jgi:hypothetical protein
MLSSCARNGRGSGGKSGNFPRDSGSPRGIRAQDIELVRTNAPQAMCMGHAQFRESKAIGLDGDIAFFGKHKTGNTKHRRLRTSGHEPLAANKLFPNSRLAGAFVRREVRGLGANPRRQAGNGEKQF